MSPSERETEEHATPGLLERDALCGSVLLGRSFLVELPLVGAVTIGREADADLQLGHGSVSRRHARLDLRGDHGTVTDLGSRNGTFVNGERLTGAPHRVARGDELSFGSARMALFSRAMVPVGARAVLVRPSLLARLDADVAAGPTSTSSPSGRGSAGTRSTRCRGGSRASRRTPTWAC